MEKLIAFIFCWAMIAAAFSQQAADAQSCLAFRTGTFAYENPELADVQFKRNRNKQTETVKREGDKLKYEFGIIWTSPCDYTLTLTEVSDYSDRKMLGTKLYIKIKSVFEDGYSFVSYDSQGERKEGRVRRVR